MVVRLVAKVQMESMEPTIIYPTDGSGEERIALLTGIIQLVSAALEMSDKDATNCATRFMKAETGVIGYCSKDTHIIICEGDEEYETEAALRAVLSGVGITENGLPATIDKDVKKRGNEIGDLWS